jgi:hypothetical protein
VTLAVAVRADPDAEQLIERLRRGGYGLLATVEQAATGRLATARLLPPGETEEGIVVDLLFASSGMEPEIIGAAANIDVGARTPVRVARTGHLVALKLLSQHPTRPQDTLDLNVLKAALDAEEEERARRACELIVQRGYHRGRDLPALLTALLATG